MSILNSVKWARVKVYLFFRLFTAWKYRTIYHMDIGRNTGINRKAKLDKNIYPEGIHIGDNCNILGGQSSCLMMHVET